MTDIHPQIEAALGRLPEALLDRSGSVFYSGRSAFRSSSNLYIMGLNPGGSPVAQARETIRVDLAEWRDFSHEHWSAYVDESWQGCPPGRYGMQPRVRHMFDRLGRDVRQVPAANLFFVRSANEAAISREKDGLVRACWPVHEAVIRALDVRAILALGGTVGRWVREQLGAHSLSSEFREENARGWTSQVHRAADGRAVITVTHPGRADWRNPAADPTGLVRDTLSA